MKTKGKVLASVLLLGIVFLCNTVITDFVQPEVNTELALEQFANPSTQVDSALRATNSVDWSLYLILGWAGVTALMFTDEIKGAIKNEK
jgi:hypothetical protein